MSSSDIDMISSISTSPGSASSTAGSSTSAPSTIILSPSSQYSQDKSTLLRSPSEIIHRVLCNSGADDPFAIAQAAKTCKELRSFIYENPDSALWRDIYLRRYDDPRRAAAFPKPRTVTDWRQKVQDREFVCRIMRDWQTDKLDELAEYLDLISATLLDLYLDCPASNDPPQPHDHTSDLASSGTRNAVILNQMLRSEAFRHLYTYHSTRETKPLLRPLRAQPGNPNRRAQREAVSPDLMRLHLLCPPDFVGGDDAHREQRGWLRETVYSAVNFTEANDWGPFHTDGTVDWVLLDATSSIMMGNAKDVLSMGEDNWRRALPPMSYGIEPTRSWGFNDLRRPESLAEDEVWDWAGVEGLWCGSYAFLDYTDWIALNEPRLIQLRRSLNALDLSRYHEAVGDLMQLDITIDKEKSNPSSASGSTSRHGEPLPEITTPLPTSSLLPPIYFHGSSVQTNGLVTYPSNTPSSFVRGVVQLTADDPPQVRWTLVIRYGGEDRWRLECVQVGGRGSKRGFFGVWTDALKEEHSPNGPVWYWKPEA